MKNLKFVIVFCLSLVVTSCSGQSKNDELNGLYCNKFGQLIYFNNGDMHFFKSTFLHVFQKQEKETYTYKDKKVIYKYDDITLNHENDKVVSLNHRGRDYKRMNTIGDIINMKNLGLDKIHKRINKTNSLSMETLKEIIKKTNYLKHTNIIVIKVSIDDLIINML
jgi:hypothetical protein